MDRSGWSKLLSMDAVYCCFLIGQHFLQREKWLRSSHRSRIFDPNKRRSPVSQLETVRHNYTRWLTVVFHTITHKQFLDFCDENNSWPSKGVLSGNVFGCVECDNPIQSLKCHIKRVICGYKSRWMSLTRAAVVSILIIEALISVARTNAHQRSSTLWCTSFWYEASPEVCIRASNFITGCVSG